MFFFLKKLAHKTNVSSSYFLRTTEKFLFVEESLKYVVIYKSFIRLLDIIL